MQTTREAADAARVAAAHELTSPAGAQARASWGSVAEAVAASGLPAHLQAAAMAAADRQGVPSSLPAYGGKAVSLDVEAVASILLRGWQAERRQQALMLAERFVAADGIGNGLLTLPDLWRCLSRLLRAMVATGGEAAALAEPWLEPGAAETLYDAMLTESLFLTPTLREGVISRPAFVAVMLRHSLVDVDYEAWLELHPEERNVIL